MKAQTEIDGTDLEELANMAGNHPAYVIVAALAGVYQHVINCGDGEPDMVSMVKDLEQCSDAIEKYEPPEIRVDLTPPGGLGLN